MKVVYTLRHRLHHPEHEIEAGRVQEPFEHPGRAEIIRAALAAEDDVRVRRARRLGDRPDRGGARAWSGASSSSTAWEEYQRSHPGTHDVVPDVFALPALRDGMGPARRTDRYRDAPRLVVLRDDDTADARHLRRRLVLPSTSLSPPPTTCSAASRSRTGCVDHPVTTRPGPPMAATASSTTLPSWPITSRRRTGGKVAVLDVDYHHGNGTQQIFYDRDDVQFVSLHGDPDRAYPYVTGFRDERGAGRRESVRPRTIRSPPGSTMTTTWPRSARRATSCRRSVQTSSSCRSASTRTSTIRSATSPSRRTDSRQSGAMIRELGLPTVVLQEGGYATDELGENVAPLAARGQLVAGWRRPGLRILTTIAATAIIVSSNASA